MRQPIKLVVATKRKKCVPPRNAGDAKDMHSIPKICKKNKMNVNITSSKN